ncbi:hypothetical protein GH714_043764 [Hevea brasiliensis]|uniref:Uncharacterized protein n=1 Tax=Hevea brasiliensis TaxID=3981 RepID=A0A6A6K2B1_HEVBR|nr:hypothetical protein GH714_043764 [Hevea brasiliensis]
MEVKKGDDHQVREGAASSSMKVCIGIGDDDRGPVIRHGKALLTEAQLCELQRQVIIYKPSAGLPVQVLPFWKSVSSSFGFVNGGICRLYPSFQGYGTSCLNRSYVDVNQGDVEEQIESGDAAEILFVARIIAKRTCTEVQRSVWKLPNHPLFSVPPLIPPPLRVVCTILQSCPRREWHKLNH